MNSQEVVPHKRQTCGLKRGVLVVRSWFRTCGKRTWFRIAACHFHFEEEKDIFVVPNLWCAVGIVLGFPLEPPRAAPERLKTG